jgi:hypothetical protein
MASKKTGKKAAPKAKVKAKVKTKAKAKAAPARRKKSARNVNPWTPADEKKLKQMAGKMSTPKIAKALRRSVAAVTFKAFAMRLSLRMAKSNRGRRLVVAKKK